MAEDQGGEREGRGMIRVAVTLALATAGQTAPVVPPAAPTADPAISPEALAAARRLLTATGADERRGAATNDTIERVIALAFLSCNSAGKRDKSCGSLKASDHLRGELRELRPELEAAIIDAQERAYARRLSIAEMNAVTAFAQTPAGRTFFAQAASAALDADATATSIVLDRVAGIIGSQTQTVQDPVR